MEDKAGGGRRGKRGAAGRSAARWRRGVAGPWLAVFRPASHRDTDTVRSGTVQSAVGPFQPLTLARHCRGDEENSHQ